jgi:RNA-binding protein
MPAPLTSSRRSELRAQAHQLSPVVIIGDKGLTDEVLKEIDRSLKAHELIKVRAATDDRKAREAWMGEICRQLEAHDVQQIGKVLVIYRENFDKPREKKGDPGSLPQRSGARDDGKRTGARGDGKRTGAPDDRKRSGDRDDKKKIGARDGKKRAGAGVDRKRTGAGNDRKRIGAGDDKRLGARGRKFGSAQDGRRTSHTGDDETTRTSRQRSRTPSPRPASGPRRRRPRSSQ